MGATFATVDPGSPDVLVADVDGAVVGYSHVLHRWIEEDGTWVGLHLGYVLPQFRHRGIGTAMVRWAQERLRDVWRLDAPTAPGVFATNVSSTERDAARLIESFGYSCVRTLIELGLDDFAHLEPVPLPPGLELRALSPGHERAIFETFTDAWRGAGALHGVGDAALSDFVEENFRGRRFDPSLWSVAWDAAEVAGFVSGVLVGATGVIPEVAVGSRWQRRGIARALVTETLRRLDERGAASVRIVTNADDPFGARRLYESLGFGEVKRHLLYRQEIEPPIARQRRT